MRKFCSSLVAAGCIAHATTALAVCVPSSLNGGTVNVDQTYLKAELRSIATGNPGNFGLWVRPREDGCIGLDSDGNGLEGTQASIETKDGQTIAVANNPLCHTDTWGSMVVPMKQGEPRSDGTIAYIGRIPLSRSNSDHSSYSAHHYDYMVVVNANGTLNKFCTDSVNGSMETGDSSYWTR